MATYRKRISRPKTRRRTTGVPKPRQRTRAHLPIIECDSAKLAAGELDLGTAFGNLLKSIFPEKRITVLPTSTEAKLTEDLADIYKTRGRFRSVLIVGHSNATGLALTADSFRGWIAVGKWLEKFETGILLSGGLLHRRIRGGSQAVCAGRDTAADLCISLCTPQEPAIATRGDYRHAAQGRAGLMKTFLEGCAS
jgi:hypothetical protein